ncbi:uncharacterized protein EI90DRAFT_3044532 [Cantharellus anzutake]|uniref:uncharacterized protein n=1 Tax=Cantharellus anzutake TaxID=1750568 RepID=UPI0019062E5E|nr:uncharacterized protein EI90DRAFT_3044532 [Cantharellus anzutake]KAF8337011.1 hypothetical protein EI90DRAFT_3044532 [Cantharellus anzutake]
MFEQFFDFFRGAEDTFVFGEDLGMANSTIPPPLPDTTHGLLFPKYEDIIIPEQSEYPPTLWDFYSNTILPDALYLFSGAMSMEQNEGSSSGLVQNTQPEYLEDRDAEGEPDPWYELSCSVPAPIPLSQGTQKTPVTSYERSDASLPIPSSSSTPPDNMLNGPSPTFSDLPSIPRALYAYGVKRDARSKKVMGISSNERRPCPLCSDDFHKSRSTSSSKENDWWRHLQQVHLKNDVISYIAKGHHIDIIALLFFTTLRFRFEEHHDERWFEPTREEYSEIRAFHSVYGEDRTNGPIIFTIEGGEVRYPRLMARLESFAPSWWGHFICPSCDTPIGRDRAKDRHPPGHCNGRGEALPPPEFTPWPLHPIAIDGQTAKRPHASPTLDSDDYAPPRKKPCKRKRGD